MSDRTNEQWTFIKVTGKKALHCTEINLIKFRKWN